MKKYLLTILLISLLFATNLPASDSPDYKLQPTDVLLITVYGHEDLTTRTRVSSDGHISFPLLGKVRVEELTAQDLEHEIKKLLEKDYIISAEVIVFIEEYHPRQISVIGEVNKPGKYDMPNEKDITVLEAIAMAEGFTKDADVNGTRVVRVKNDGKKVIRVKVTDITNKGEKDKDVVLQSEDVVYVPESFF
ncbi:MAG: polysaccharide biosynthesis/export family protein [Candidatus Omnitrophica bacterium]|nr:polysaccharide biosynthesis/export family protein [Candidatus Omnitrophota bacterium]